MVGSGVSHAAGIPTGWEITCDLIRKVAISKGEQIEGDPGEWYERSYNKPPDYSDLLEELAKTPDERRALLSSYFEPTKEERERGLKLPSRAHRAIAELVHLGYVRVILTTNFDRLLQTALSERGIEPTMIYTNEQVSGFSSLWSVRCLVWKIHGDYRDSRILNTESELKEYPEEINRLLDRILGEFGLIVCGWSAKWDIALRKALERSTNHRFTTFWAYKGALEEEASRLISLRGATQIPISDADSFFEDLLTKVQAVEALGRNHPILAKEEVKLYLAEHRYRIRLHDLISLEIQETKERIVSANFPTNCSFVAGEYCRRRKAYQTMSDSLLSMLLPLAYHDPGQHTKLLIRAIESLGPLSLMSIAYSSEYELLRFYPALRCFYGAGLAALANQRWKNLVALLCHAECTDTTQLKKIPAVGLLNPKRVLEEWNARNTLERESQVKAPGSEFLFKEMQPALLEYVAEENYEEVFDRFEHLLSFKYLDFVNLGRIEENNVPFGRYLRRIDINRTDAVNSEIFKPEEVLPKKVVERFKFTESWDRFYQLWLAHRNLAFREACYPRRSAN